MCRRGRSFALSALGRPARPEEVGTGRLREWYDGSLGRGEQLIVSAKGVERKSRRNLSQQAGVSKTSALPED